MTPELSPVLPVLAGIYDQRRPFINEEGARVALGSLLDGKEMDVVAGGRLALAHRSATVDRSNGTRSFVIGRIWNPREGHGPPAPGEGGTLAARFRQKADGASLLEPLRGSFGIVLWDTEEERGLVAGDHAGSYAIYYFEAGGRLYFASELAPLLRLLPRRPAPASLAIAGSLSGGGLPGVTTMYEGVHRLPEGTFLQLGPAGMERCDFWVPRQADPVRSSRAELVTELWRHVEDAVDKRLAHGGHSSIVMSGGIDSSCVAAAAMQRLRPGDSLTGYGAVFPEYPDVDESTRIEALVAALKLRSTQLEVRPAGALRLALEFLARWETGFPGPGYLLEHELLSRAAADGATVALDGQGGDEVFGHWPYVPSDLLLRGKILASWRSVQRFPGGSDRSLREISSAWRRVALRGAIPHRMHAALRRRAGPENHVPSWLKHDLGEQYMEASDTWEWKKQPAPRSWAYVSNLLAGSGRAGFAEYLRRRAASFGIEAQPPLLDVDLTEFVLRMPPEQNFDPFTDRPLIREAMIHLVPDTIRFDQRKSNLAPFYFDAVWADFDAIRSLLGAPDARIFEFVERSSIQQMVSGPGSRHEPDWLRRLGDIWNLAGLEAWLRHEEDPQSVEHMLEAWNLSRPSSELRAPGRARAV